MEVFILGTSGMMPLPNRHLTSMLLRHEGSLFLFDCGEATQISLRKLNLKWKKIDVILISHTHADHITGLPGILMLSSQVDRLEPLTIIGPPKTKAYIEANRATLDMYINYEIEIIEIDPSISQVVYQGEDYHIRSFPLKHTKPCVGYVFEEDKRPGSFYPERALALGIPQGPLWGRLQKGEEVSHQGQIIKPEQVMGAERPGRRVSYVTDTLYFEQIAEEVYDSDLLICEGMFYKDKEDQAKEKKHMCAFQAGMVAEKAKVEAMGLIHYSPRYTDKQLKNLQVEAAVYYPDAFLCRDRQNIPIPNRTASVDRFS